jgi:hypothetical protein
VRGGTDYIGVFSGLTWDQRIEAASQEMILVIELFGDNDRFDARIEITAQSPKRAEPQGFISRTDFFDGPGSRLLIEDTILLRIGREGTTWINVFVNGTAVTRVPVSIIEPLAEGDWIGAAFRD